jgi:signal transduction histidine kinase
MRGDPQRLRQVFVNLLSNAHKYTPAGGQLRLQVRALPHAVYVDVQDSGIGMSADEQAQLFTKFFRADNPVTRQVSGTGLGLVITRSLVEMHGGTISVVSAPGEGSTFTVMLPVGLAPGQDADASADTGPLDLAA